MSQRELQRVTVISRCAQGNLICDRAAELLALSPRHVKRLKSRYRLGGAAALARTRYAGFNDHHLHEKLVETEGFSLSRETLRRLLRTSGVG
ncbi:MAG: helix-turn-helix domain-containing protein, partial [Candidatus Acidiferrales bacterium]